MKIHRHANYKDPVKLNDIHGEFAYKNYMEIRGTELFGKYIVIVSDDDLGIEYNKEAVEKEYRFFSFGDSMFIK